MKNYEEVLWLKKALSVYSEHEINEALDILCEPVDKQELRRYLLLKQDAAKIRNDVFENTILGATTAEMEKLRIRTWEEYQEEKDWKKKLDILISAARKIKEFLVLSNYVEFYKQGSWASFSIGVTLKMLLGGFALLDVVKALPDSEINDVYEVATKYLGLSVALSEEEAELLHKKLEKPDGLMMRDIRKGVELLNVMPSKNKDGMWKFNADNNNMAYTTLSMAKKIAGCTIQYPYYESGVLKSKDSFESLLDKVLLNYDIITFEGLENHYSPEEINLVLCLQSELKGMAQNLTSHFEGE